MLEFPLQKCSRKISVLVEFSACYGSKRGNNVKAYSVIITVCNSAFFDSFSMSNTRNEGPTCVLMSLIFQTALLCL